VPIGGANCGEKTGIVDIIACYNIPDPKAIWYPWAKEHLGFKDIEFLNADTENQITLFAMVAEKNTVMIHADFNVWYFFAIPCKP
jgi:hypothetical protein